MSFRSALALATLLLLAGCATAPRSPSSTDRGRVDSPATGEVVVRTAARFVGTPYRYGGASPRGFDCSGLVFFSHSLSGLRVPRTTVEQRRAARKVSLRSLRPGDLLFFRMAGRKIDHVGIYAGDGRFIHAPSSGRTVSYARLDEPYYRKRLVSAGRLWSSQR